MFRYNTQRIPVENLRRVGFLTLSESLEYTKPEDFETTFVLYSFYKDAMASAGLDPITYEFESTDAMLDFIKQNDPDFTDESFLFYHMPAEVFADFNYNSIALNTRTGEVSISLTDSTYSNDEEIDRYIEKVFSLLAGAEETLYKPLLYLDDEPPSCDLSHYDLDDD